MREVSVIQVFNNKTNMKILSNNNVIIFPLLFIIMTSCKTFNSNMSINNNTSNYKLQENQNYNIIEAKREALYGNYSKSITILDKIIENDSLNATAHYELANNFFNINDQTKALYHAKKSYEFDNHNIWFALFYLTVLEHNSNIKEANAVFKTIISRWESNIDIWYQYFQFLDKHELFADLNKHLDLFEKKFGYSSDLIFSRFHSFIRQKKYKEIEKYLKKILSVDVNNYTANILLAEYYLDCKEVNKSLDIYRRLISINENDESVLLGLVKIYILKNDIKSILDISNKIIDNTNISAEIKIQFVLELSQVLETDQKKYSITIYNFVSSLKSQYPDNPEILNLYGDVEFRKGNSSAAINAFTKSLQIKPINLNIWLLTLYILEKEHNYQRLLAVSDSALIYFPSQKDIFLFRGYANMQLDNNQSSYDDFLYALKLTGAIDNDRAQILHYLAEVTHKLNIMNETYRYYDEILLINGNDYVALNNYAYYLSLDDKNLDKALEMSAKAIKVESRNSTYLDTYAYILYKLKRYKEALKYIEMAILNGGGKSGVILEHYGDILYMNGQVDHAVSAWKEAQDKGENSIILNKKIENRKIDISHDDK